MTTLKTLLLLLSTVTILRAAERPNILLYGDDLGYGDLGWPSNGLSVRICKLPIISPNS